MFVDAIVSVVIAVGVVIVLVSVRLFVDVFERVTCCRWYCQRCQFSRSSNGLVMFTAIHVCIRMVIVRVVVN